MATTRRRIEKSDGLAELTDDMLRRIAAGEYIDELGARRPPLCFFGFFNPSQRERARDILLKRAEE